jgi:hypothetical protein
MNNKTANVGKLCTLCKYDFRFFNPSNENRAVPNVPVVDASILQIDKSILDPRLQHRTIDFYKISKNLQTTVRKLSF